jgi:hypothetical protein
MLQPQPPVKDALQDVKINITSAVAAMQRVNPEISVEAILKILFEEAEATRFKEAVGGDERARREFN